MDGLYGDFGQVRVPGELPGLTGTAKDTLRQSIENLPLLVMRIEQGWNRLLDLDKDDPAFDVELVAVTEIMHHVHVAFEGFCGAFGSLILRRQQGKSDYN